MFFKGINDIDSFRGSWSKLSLEISIGDCGFLDKGYLYKWLGEFFELSCVWDLIKSLIWDGFNDVLERSFIF